MRILYISNSTSGGGAPASLFNIVEVLSSRHEVAVVLPSASGRLHDLLVARGIRCYADVDYCLDIWPRCQNPFKWIVRMVRLWRNSGYVRKYIGNIIDEYEPDIVHTNVGPLAIAAHESLRRGIPHVWHMREYQDKDFGMTFFPSKSSFRRLINTPGNHNIAITKDIFRHWGLRPERDTVIYNAVRQGEALPVRNDSSERYFLYAARIEKGKGLMNVLRAFRIYRNSGGQSRLKVAGVGRGLYNIMCRMYVKVFRLSDSVDFLGFRDDVRSLMACADAFVMSSISEGFGLTTVEAMQEGCLVIGMNTAGTAEQFDRGRELCGREIGVRFSDIRTLAAAMESVSSPENQDGYTMMKADARRVALECYSIDRYASEIEEFYLKIRKG